ncbi:MAG TPA: serine hydrolase [Pyrinomonadaceae bacterium]|nr:serine hydrolase [Pyrinomonadaceae bacterium]
MRKYTACFVFSLSLVLVQVVPSYNLLYGRSDRAAATTQKTFSLPRSSPEQQGISSSDLLAFVEAADKEIDAMNSLMIVRHGHVIAEGWWGPYDRDTPHILYSLSKSFTSTAVGLAISEGKLSLDDQVLKFFPEDAPADPSANLRAMRVRDLLRMSSGNQTEALIRAVDSGSGTDSWTKIFLAHPVPFKPGTHFLYNSPASYMLSAIVQKVTGMTVLEYLRPRLFDPLGFKDPRWISSPQGITAGAYGLSARTEELASFGVLYLQKGMWNGKQLIPAAWVEQATSMQTSNGSAPTSDWDQGYGYQFWRSRHHSFRGDGAFGQYCMVIPELDTVVAMTSGVRDMQKVMNLVWDKLLPAMKDGRLPENATTRKQLESRLAGLTVKFPNGLSSSRSALSISGKWFELPENERGLKAISFDFNSATPMFRVQTAAGETRTPLGFNTWIKSRGSFTNGLDRFLSVPDNPLIAASGAWTSEDTYTLRIVLYETPFYSTTTFKFDGDRVLIDSEHNVAFGPTKLPQLTGHLRT